MEKLRQAMLKRERIREEGVMELRVAGATSVRSLATNILRSFEEQRHVVLSFIGPNAAWVSLKAVAVAQQEVAQQGMTIVGLPFFDVQVVIDRQSGAEVDMTGMKVLLCKQMTDLGK